MVKLRAWGKTLVLVSGLVASLTHCQKAESGDDDDAGAAGDKQTGGAGAAAGTGGTTGGSGGGGAGGTMGGGAGGLTAAGGSASGAGGGGVSGGAGKPASSGTGGGPPAVCADSPVVPSPRALPAPVEQADFEAQFPALACAAAKPCCALSTVAYDEAKCLEYAKSNDALDRTKAFDRIEAGICLQSLAAAAAQCNGGPDYRGLPSSCVWTYRGPVALGEECDVSSDCLPDPRGRVSCDWVDELEMSACKVTIAGKVGEACNTSCQIEVDSGTCIDSNDPEDPTVETVCFGEDGLMCDFGGHCVAQRSEGCECSYGQGECNPNLQCLDADDDGFGDTCRPRSGVGEACIIDEDCTLGLGCADDDTCAPRKKFGEPCNDHWDCAGGFCYLEVCGLDNGDPRGFFHDAYCDGAGTE